MHSIEELRKSLTTGFIDYAILSREQYQPRLILNDHKKGKRVLTTLLKELNECQAFYFSVAFITNSGIASIISVLKELEEKGVQGCIIASSYQNFTQPQALRRLKALKNVKLRIVTENNFHAKSYIFKSKDQYTLIIGSSNLTQNALSYNAEWNLKVTSSENGELLKYTLGEYKRTFDEAQEVTEEWLNAYEKIYEHQFKKQQIIYTIEEQKPVLPNQMQLEALKALDALRQEQKDKALLISATGTGKTYFSAFDAQRVKPKHLLFVVHRENIARASLRSYRKIFGPTVKMGLLSGKTKETEADYLFSTVQTLSKDYVLEQFAPDYFDYIVIDEVHRAGAKSYEKILSYFKPQFLLGMTATPERMDGYNIYEAFDYNIAYEIRLNQALEQQMLCPFHYYGISELTINGQVIDDKTAFNQLVSKERVDYIIEKAQLYGHDQGKVRGLVFCSKVEEARKLAEAFNQRGFRAIALSGENSEQERENAILRLEQKEATGDYLDYIFTVDIFNEGVDIPSVNQIIMLRPTQSSIVFVQQMGRGLRKAAQKEYVVIIDFIGNYANNFLVPIALYGDRSYNKDNLRKLMSMGSCNVPGVSTIDFDRITKERIYEAINVTNIATKKALIEAYQLLKYQLGRIPMMMDFVKHDARDPIAFIQYSNSYYEFIAPLEESLRGQLTPKMAAHLAFYSKELGTAKRVEELVILKHLIEREGTVTVADISQQLAADYGYQLSPETLKSSLNFLNGKFFKTQDQAKYQYPESVLLKNEQLDLAETFKQELKHPVFKKFLMDLTEYGIFQYKAHYTSSLYDSGLIRYEKYSRKDVCHLLNWEKDESSTMYGYRIKYDTCPIFVTYNKKADISESTKYEDIFINKKNFSWLTRSGVKENSKEAIAIRDAEKNGLRVLLFVKKSDDEGTDFYYMGDMLPYSLMETTIKNDKGELKPIVNINFQLEHEVEDHLYYYLEKNEL